MVSNSSILKSSSRKFPAFPQFLLGIHSCLSEPPIHLQDLKSGLNSTLIFQSRVLLYFILLIRLSLRNEQIKILNQNVFSFTPEMRIYLNFLMQHTNLLLLLGILPALLPIFFLDRFKAIKHTSLGIDIPVSQPRVGEILKPYSICYI